MDGGDKGMPSCKSSFRQEEVVNAQVPRVRVTTRPAGFVEAVTARTWSSSKNREEKGKNIQVVES